jgi:hypothetical protein
VIPSNSVVAEDVRFLSVPGFGVDMPVRFVWRNALELGFAVNYLSEAMLGIKAPEQEMVGSRTARGVETNNTRN